MIYWILFIALEILRNWVLIVPMKLRPSYSWNRAIRISFGIIILVCTHPDFDPLGDYTTIWRAFPFGVFQATSFGLFFDPGLSLLRGLRWDYQGKNSGPIDKLSKSNYHIFKIACLILFILSSFNLWQQ